jgi:hypothetical protein
LALKLKKSGGPYQPKTVDFRMFQGVIAIPQQSSFVMKLNAFGLSVDAATESWIRNGLQQS